MVDPAPLAQAEAVAEADRAGHGDSLEAARQRVEVGVVQAAGVDPAHAADRHRHPRHRPDHARVELLTLLGAALFGVVEHAERPAVAHRQPLVVDQHPGGDQRPRERAAPGLIGAGDEPRAQLAVELEQLRRLTSPALQRIGALGFRRGRFGPGASKWRRPFR
jgi:hypothetical protein